MGGGESGEELRANHAKVCQSPRLKVHQLPSSQTDCHFRPHTTATVVNATRPTSITAAAAAAAVVVIIVVVVVNIIVTVAAAVARQILVGAREASCLKCGEEANVRLVQPPIPHQLRTRFERRISGAHSHSAVLCYGLAHGVSTNDRTCRG